ncbi:hypothetical protein [Succinivibrio sp.]|uniref:hypothetical protein n=1 Tax=Succinivibrio sp. TaxID=2053619 RepID=UPI00386AE52D
MLSFKNTLIAGVVAFAVGYLAGYAVRDDQAEIERLNIAKAELEQERANLIQQLEVEHEHQKTTQINAAKTQEDLDDLEKRYASAVDELNALQLQFAGYSDYDSTALSEDASASSSVSQGKCGCSGADKRKLQKVINEQLIVAKDCDINATYLNNLIEWYGSISK